MMLGTGCSSVVSDYCLIAIPMEPTDNDKIIISNKLARNILTNDETYEKLCKTK